MPDVVLKTREHFFSRPLVMTAADMEKEHPLAMFTKQLAIIVATAMTIPGGEGELNEKDIEVEFHEFGPFDVHQDDVEIMVFANRYEEREANIEVRRKIIEEAAQRWIEFQPESVAPNLREIKSLSVWTPLVLGGAYGKVSLWKTHRIHGHTTGAGEFRLECRLCRKYVVRETDMSLSEWNEEKARFLAAHYPYVEDIV